MRLPTLEASIKIHGGACTAFAYHVMLSSIVLPAKENKQKNISALQPGQPESRIEECACNAKQERRGFGLARPVTNGGHSYNFRPSLSSGLREKMELRYVTLVTQKLRRKFSASEQRQPPLHGWSRCVKEFAVLRFCERHGKQLPKSEMHNNCSQSNFLQRRIQ
jgi:hypothetical protein